MEFAVGYQHFADGRPFGEIACAHAGVREIYFPWPREPSGRPQLGYEEETDQAMLFGALRRDLTRCRAVGIKLDLLLNANCYGSQAMSVALEEHVREILDALDDWGLLPEIVTAASPFIARTVKKFRPSIETRASVNMRLTTLQAMEYLAPLFDSYYLGRDVQRHLDTVRAARAWCDAHGKKLCILANSGCLRNCPWQTFHDNLVSHATAALAHRRADFTPHLCWTLYKNPANLVEILKATWIRPEDLHRYEGLVDVVKLATRQHANPDMVISAYERGSFSGNLLDLFEPGFSPIFFPRYVDNEKFPPDWFERSGDCPRECTRCGFCEEVFAKVCRMIGEDDGR